MDEQTLRKILQEELKGFATKEELKGLATKEDLKELPTKVELKEELKVLKDDLESYILDVFTSADKNKAEKTDVEVLKVKVNKLEKEVFPTL